MKLASCLCILAAAALAQPARQTIKPVPAPGIAVPAEGRAELEAGLARLRAATEKLAGNPLLPDVLIYQEAIRYALQYNEFFKPTEIAAAKVLLQQGEDRARQLAAGQSPWTTATGLVVRGYISKIDHSVQPYGLVIPLSYSPTAPHRWRLDAWFHGRDEALSEVNFITGRQRSPGEFTPRDTIVLHLYGRFCNANRFAGEVDFFEALDAVKRFYPIDDNRILVRGFSMGGASAWQFGTHYAGLWAAVAPGAGFSETAQFLHLREMPPIWEQKLWHLYDAADYAINLSNVPVIEYHGEIDGQKQAGDVMEHALAEEGMHLVRIEGPQTPHRYHPDSKIILDRMLDAIAQRGRDPYPRRVRFTTWTLAYNQMDWVTIDGLRQHWERVRVDAEITGDAAVSVTTSNVTALTLEMGPGGCPFDVDRKPVISIDGQKVTAPQAGSDRSWRVRLQKSEKEWAIADSTPVPGRHKVHGLQGPIDDAFLDSFIFVSPTGTPLTAATAGWVATEEKHAITEWRRQFRGDAQVRDDKDITDADIAASNLILWGDPGSNKILARIAARLPIRWDAQGVVFKGNRYSDTHVPLLIYPNPLNPKKYVVLNSGFTFREYDYLNNARQSPKLPDYAIVDITTPPNEHYPGKIVQAGFFNEEWKP